MRKTRSNGVGDMRLVQLMPNYDLTKFDCGDEDLNDFLRSDSINSYPSIKIGRFAVSKSCQGKSIGSDVMDGIKKILRADSGRSAFRYLTVDAYLSAIPFYEKNGFSLLSKKEEGDETRLMFYDMMEIA